MRYLLLMRHGKAEEYGRVADDHDRRLKGRGRRAAAAVGRRLADEGPLPEVVLASTAARALETAELVAEAADVGPVLRHAGLYGADPDDLLAVVADLPDDVATVLLVGHNPGMEELVAELTGQHVWLRTADLALIRVHRGGWSDLARRGCSFAGHWVARDQDADADAAAAADGDPD